MLRLRLTLHPSDTVLVAAIGAPRALRQFAFEGVFPAVVAQVMLIVGRQDYQLFRKWR